MRGRTRLEYCKEQRQQAALEQRLPVRGHRGGLGAEAQAAAQVLELHARRLHAQRCMRCMLIALLGGQRVAQRRDWNDRAGAEAEAEAEGYGMGAEG